MKIVKALATVFVVTLAFGSGYVMRSTKSPAHGSKARTILYYVDAMNPAYKSDTPGVAADGMALQAVYADDTAGTIGTTGDARRASLPAAPRECESRPTAWLTKGTCR